MPSPLNKTIKRKKNKKCVLDDSLQEVVQLLGQMREARSDPSPQLRLQKDVLKRQLKKKMGEVMRKTEHSKFLSTRGQTAHQEKSFNSMCRADVSSTRIYRKLICSLQGLSGAACGRGTKVPAMPTTAHRKQWQPHTQCFPEHHLLLHRPHVSFTQIPTPSSLITW